MNEWRKGKNHHHHHHLNHITQVHFIISFITSTCSCSLNYIHILSPSFHKKNITNKIQLKKLFNNLIIKWSNENWIKVFIFKIDDKNYFFDKNYFKDKYYFFDKYLFDKNFDDKNILFQSFIIHKCFDMSHDESLCHLNDKTMTNPSYFLIY